ncbi:unnamed protein product [Leptidea sinapis]|uniref:Uncharacterized protein n=1 Tax=Leptidea sinapis TaxID=189913 RepID=A0A5E4QCF5_9NEOP|nr:unnamed protein product [Leptidea sinapis]
MMSTAFHGVLMLSQQQRAPGRQHPERQVEWDEEGEGVGRCKDRIELKSEQGHGEDKIQYINTTSQNHFYFNSFIELKNKNDR